MVTLTRTIPETTDSPRRLGRHVQHDPRSYTYAVGVIPKAAIKSVSWTRRTPILDQGNVGSCTGNALAGLLGTDAKGRAGATSVTVKADSRGVFKAGTYPLDEAFAVKAYSLNTWLDTIPGEYPGKDTGSSGVACGKSAQMLGLATGYSHAFGVDALKAALQTGPTLIGIPWLNSMFNPDSGGQLTVDRTSGIAGGHELVVSGYDVGGWFRIDNSWGAAWGDQGSCHVREADIVWLLAQDGDITVPQLAAAPTKAATGAQVAAAVRAALTAQGV
jgi:hypothetical protein